MRKTILIILICEILAIGLTGCGKQKEENITDSEHIESEKSDNKIICENDICVSLVSENNNEINNAYYKSEERNIYIANNIDEFYMIEDGIRIPFKKQLLRSDKNLDDFINEIISKLNFKYSYDDGGTSIYKTDNEKISIMICNTLDGNKDIYIGLDNIEYTESMCKNNN